jgi:GNAT superfamily N-acetyltransferase
MGLNCNKNKRTNSVIKTQTGTRILITKQNNTLALYRVADILAAILKIRYTDGPITHDHRTRMDIIQENLDIHMIREHLDEIPDCALPAGYSTRWYQPGDEKSWYRIHLLADAYTNVTPDLYEKEFGSDTQMLAERQCFLVDRKGVLIGTATAWLDDHSVQSPGRIHWVAIVPAEQGKGLAKPLLTAVCNRLKDLGHSKAYLTTQTIRIAAINLYLKFGFVPAVNSERDKQIWRRLQMHLKYAVQV